MSASITLSGVSAQQTITDREALQPFSGDPITATDETDDATAMVELSAPNGILSNTAGTVDTATGSWSFSGSLAAVQVALSTLVFTPLVGQTSLGNVVSTTLVATVSDAAATGTVATNGTTTVSALAVTAATESFLSPIRDGGTAEFIDLAPAADNVLPSGDYKAELLTGSTSATLTEDTTTHQTLLVANAGNDLLTGSYDTLVGGTGTDTLMGSGNLMIANEAADIITGSGVTGTIVAGAGGQTIDASQSGFGVIFLADGSATVSTGVGDTVVGGSGAATISALAGSTGSYGALVFGGGGAMTFLAGTGAGTVVASTSPTTVSGGYGGVVFGGSALTTYYGGTGSSIFVGGSGPSLVFGDSGGGSIYGGTGSGEYIANPHGNQIVAGTGPSTIFSLGQSLVYLVGTANTIVVAGTGNETLVGTASTGQNQYYLGSGSDTLIGGGVPDTIVGGTGTAVIKGSSAGNLYAFFDGTAGGTDTITGFVTGRDLLGFYDYYSDASGEGALYAAQFQNYPGNPTAALNYAITSAVVAYGSTTLALSDGTHIVFPGVTNLPYGPDPYTPLTFGP